MPRPINPDEARWELTGPRELVGKGGALRRLVDRFMAQHENPDITYPEALLELSQAGYSKLVSTPPHLDGPTPMQRRMGRVHD